MCVKMAISKKVDQYPSFVNRVKNNVKHAKMKQIGVCYVVKGIPKKPIQRVMERKNVSVSMENSSTLIL